MYTAGVGKKKNKIFLLGMKVILRDYYCIYQFEDNDIVLPILVLAELDKFKIRKRSHQLSCEGLICCRVTRFLPRAFRWDRDSGSFSSIQRNPFSLSPDRPPRELRSRFFAGRRGRKNRSIHVAPVRQPFGHPAQVQAQHYAARLHTRPQPRHVFSSSTRRRT